MADLTKQQIIEANDVKIKRVEVPDWGGGVYIRVMSGTAFNTYQQSQMTWEGGTPRYNAKDATARLVSLTLCDKDGNLLFTPQEIAKLGDKSHRALSVVADAAKRLNGLDDDDMEQEEEK